MIQIGDTIVSIDILEKEFCCDLNICKGNCCIERDAGAPLTHQEIDIINKLLPQIWDDLSEKAKEVINHQGIAYYDEEGEPVTSIVNNADCVFAYTDADGICKCAIEKAWHEKKTSFPKPISCHLYPIRIKQYRQYTAINYHRWDICQCARQYGKKAGIPVYKFLKEPLIRRFGEKWYAELELTANEWKKAKLNTK